MGRRCSWTHKDLADLAHYVEAGVSWRKIAGDYKMSESWLKQLYRKYLQLQEAGTLEVLSPFQQMNLYLDWSRNVPLRTLAQTYRLPIHQVLASVHESQRLLRQHG